MAFYSYRESLQRVHSIGKREARPNLGLSLVLAVYFMIPPTPTTTIIFADAMGMLWVGVIPLVSGYAAELFGTRYMTTVLGPFFVIHQMGWVMGAWVAE